MSEKEVITIKCLHCGEPIDIHLSTSDINVEDKLSIDEVVIHTDGASRGNPGPAAYGWKVVDVDEDESLDHAHSMGNATNNYAEYRGVLHALKNFAVTKWKLVICSDSELVVKQLNGEYQTKNATLKPLASACWEVINDRTTEGRETEIKWIKSEDNQAHDVVEKCLNAAIAEGSK